MVGTDRRKEPWKENSQEFLMSVVWNFVQKTQFSDGLQCKNFSVLVARFGTIWKCKSDSPQTFKPCEVLYLCLSHCSPEHQCAATPIRLPEVALGALQVGLGVHFDVVGHHEGGVEPNPKLPWDREVKLNTREGKLNTRVGRGWVGTLPNCFGRLQQKRRFKFKIIGNVWTAYGLSFTVCKAQRNPQTPKPPNHQKKAPLPPADWAIFFKKDPNLRPPGGAKRWGWWKNDAKKNY